MALTADTTAPIVPAPFNTGGTTQTAHVMAIVCKASEAYRIGDVVVLASGAADAVDAAQTDATIIGVAIEAKTAGAAVASSNTVMVALATPGTFFQGSMTAGADTDHTPNATTATEQAFCKAAVDTVLLTTPAYLGLDGSDVTGGQCQVVRISPNQLRGKTFVLGLTTPLNPRVDFVFRCSFFQPIA